MKALGAIKKEITWTVVPDPVAFKKTRYACPLQLASFVITLASIQITSLLLLHMVLILNHLSFTCFNLTYLSFNFSYYKVLIGINKALPRRQHEQAVLFKQAKKDTVQVTINGCPIRPKFKQWRTCSFYPSRAQSDPI